MRSLKKKNLQALLTAHPEIHREDLTLIGKGAFSRVYKFQNKAIKSIYFILFYFIRIIVYVSNVSSNNFLLN